MVVLLLVGWKKDEVFVDKRGYVARVFNLDPLKNSANTIVTQVMACKPDYRATNVCTHEQALSMTWSSKQEETKTH